jgi:hypothetical protein
MYPYSLGEDKTTVCQGFEQLRSSTRRVVNSGHAVKHPDSCSNRRGRQRTITTAADVARMYDSCSVDRKLSEEKEEAVAMCSKSL